MVRTPIMVVRSHNNIGGAIALPIYVHASVSFLRPKTKGQRLLPSYRRKPVANGGRGAALAVAAVLDDTGKCILWLVERREADEPGVRLAVALLGLRGAGLAGNLHGNAVEHAGRGTALHHVLHHRGEPAGVCLA